MKATNPGSSPIYATIDDTHYEVLGGQSVDVDERTAMLLAEYGLIVDRAAVDEALEDVFTPFSEHGPGTDDTGKVVNQAAQDAFVEATQGDTSKTAAKVADLAANGTGVTAEPVRTLVSSEAGTVDEQANADDAAQAAEEKAKTARKATAR